jgi:hypothetical protein
VRGIWDSFIPHGGRENGERFPKERKRNGRNGAEMKYFYSFSTERSLAFEEGRKEEGMNAWK